MFRSQSKASVYTPYLCILILLILIGILLTCNLYDDKITHTKIIEKGTIIYTKEEEDAAHHDGNILSFLDSKYYKDRIFNSKRDKNKFLDPWTDDFMSFGPNNKKFNYVHFDLNDIDNPLLLYCSGINKAGIGNFLAQYWAARSLAFWLGYNFKMIQNSQYSKCWDDADTQTEMFDKYFNDDPHKQYWTYYLPKTVNISIFDMEHTKLNNADRNKIFIWITQAIINLDSNQDDAKKYLYKDIYRSFYYNPIFMQTLISDGNHALNEYFEQNAVAKKPVTADIVIHFRCGDILSAGGSEYGFMTLKYFKNALDKIKNDFNMSIDAQTSIYFLSQMGENSLREDGLLGKYNQERKNMNGCNVVANGMVKELEKMYAPSKIVINGNNAMNVDFYMMANAKILICSMSTFCEQAALMNRHNVILPLWGPWNKMKEMIDGQIWYPENHHFINNTMNEMTLTSHIIGQKKMKPQQVVEYLINN